MLRSTRVVVLLGVAVQIVAFLRTAIIAATLGTSPDVDAYNLGLIAPGFISTVVGAWLQMSFIGRYASLIATHETDLAASYRSRMLVLVTASAMLFAGLCYIVPEPIMRLFLPHGQGAMVSASAEALKLSGLTLIPIVIGDFLGLVLNGHGRFFAAALAPLANAVVSVLGLRLWPSATAFLMARKGTDKTILNSRQRRHQRELSHEPRRHGPGFRQRSEPADHGPGVSPWCAR